MGNIAFGSRLAADGEHLEMDPEEQAAVAEIRRLRGQGVTLRGIAADLNRRDLRTRRGTPWRLESVARIVKQTQIRVGHPQASLLPAPPVTRPVVHVT